MAFVPYFVAGVASSGIRIWERFLPIQNNSERFLEGRMNFEQATDDIVQNIHVYALLTSTKVVCDVIVLGMTGKWIYDVLIHIRSIFKGLLGCGLTAFQNGIKLSLKHFFTSLRNCSVGLILTQFKQLYDKRETILPTISMWNFCNICNQIYFFMIASTSDLKRTIQLELVKYWLECMGIIRTIAEALNIDFVKYINKSFARRSDGINRLEIDQAVDLPEIQWEPVKDPDFFQTIDLRLEDFLYGGPYDVKVTRKIRKIGKKVPEIKTDTYLVTVELGCPDGKEFRFGEAGHRDPVNTPADLVVHIRTKPHPHYRRIGSDLIYKTTVSLEDAQTGAPLQVPLIDGRTMEFNLYDHTINGNKEIIIDHAGLPDPEKGGIRGRLIVQWDIQLPDEKIGTEPTEQLVPNENSD